MNRKIKDLPSNDGIMLTRRGLLKGGIAMIAATAVPAVLQTGCSSSPESDSSTPDDAPSAKLSVPAEDVFTTESCEYIDDADSVFHVTAKADLPYKTLIRAGDNKVAATLLPCETSTPLAQVGILSLGSADHRVVLENSVGASEGYEIFDACASSDGLVWVEQNVLKDSWRVYAAPLSGSSLGTPALVDEGESSWILPSLASVGTYAFWQLAPQSPAARAAEGGCVKRHSYGDLSGSSYAFYECSPKMACDIAKDSTGIVVSHYDDESSSYSISRIDAETAEVTDTLILPSLLKPAYIGYGTTGFSFALEDIYVADGGIGNIGTYTPASSDGNWFRFPRTPLCGPAWASEWFLVKSTSVVAGVDLAGKRYFSIEPENVTQDYGEFLASSGDCERILTYSNIDYTPLNGQQIKACQVRVWEPA